MGRGPSYPYVDLEQAVGLTRKVYDFAKRSPAPVDSVIKDAWSYSPTSSSGLKVLAALKSFGLIDEVGGANGTKAAKISDRAYRILIDEPSSTQRKEALKAAVLSPRWYAYCWKTWGAEMPPSMRSNLLFDHGFVESTVDTFIRDYKKSVAFAGLTKEDSAEVSTEKSTEAISYAPKIGDYVQWEPRGVLQFTEPLRVREVTEDGKFAFVEGYSTGLPTSELTKQDAPAPKGPAPLNPALSMFASGSAPLPPTGGKMLTETFVLSEGNITIQWPANLSPESFEDFKDWLNLLERRVKRTVAKPEKSVDEEAEQA